MAAGIKASGLYCPALSMLTVAPANQSFGLELKTDWDITYR